MRIIYITCLQECKIPDKKDKNLRKMTCKCEQDSEMVPKYWWMRKQGLGKGIKIVSDRPLVSKLDLVEDIKK